MDGGRGEQTPAAISVAEAEKARTGRLRISPRNDKGDKMRKLLAMFGISLALVAIGTAPADAQVVRTSEVNTVVTGNGGTWTYNYRVWNTSPGPQNVGVDLPPVWPLIVDYEVPLDSPSVVSDVMSPSGWAYEFLSASDYATRYREPNPFGSAYVLHWYEEMIFGEGVWPDWAIAPEGYIAWMLAQGLVRTAYEPSTDGFIFTSSLGPVNGPYSTSWFDMARNIGDPPLPGGGTTGTIPYTFQLPPCPPDNPNCNQPPGVIPEPSTILLLGAGLVGLGVWGRKRMR